MNPTVRGVRLRWALRPTCLTRRAPRGVQLTYVTHVAYVTYRVGAACEVYIRYIRYARHIRHIPRVQLAGGKATDVNQFMEQGKEAAAKEAKQSARKAALAGMRNKYG